MNRDITKDEVLDIIHRRKKFYYPRGKYIIYYNGEPLFLDDKAKHFYISERTAKKMAAEHFYTSVEIIESLILDGVLEIKHIK